MAQNDPSTRHKGSSSYHGGLAAEGSVERHYCGMGYTVLARRWRGTGGEIDLVFSHASTFIFVEVKKSRTFQAAALRVSARQRERIFATATEFVAAQPQGQLSDMRFDVALVDGTGHIEILENALFGD
ncbi:MAG: YraN family protein [Pseudomonadota bacterium]